jgi:tRNA (mo5U34)-methyltransferase
LDNCSYLQESVYDLSADRHGTFDIILFLGLIYHLRHPLLALDKIYEIARQDLYVDAPIIDHIIFDKTVSSDLSERMLTEGAVLHELPLLYFTKGSETGDAFNWFMPNRKCFRDLVESSGFDVISTGDDGGWAWVSAVKGLRKFAVGIEGFNPSAMRYPANN